MPNVCVVNNVTRKKVEIEIRDEATNRLVRRVRASVAGVAVKNPHERSWSGTAEYDEIFPSPE